MLVLHTNCRHTLCSFDFRFCVTRTQPAVNDPPQGVERMVHTFLTLLSTQTICQIYILTTVIFLMSLPSTTCTRQFGAAFPASAYSRIRNASESRYGRRDSTQPGRRAGSSYTTTDPETSSVRHTTPEQPQIQDISAFRPTDEKHDELKTISLGEGPICDKRRGFTRSSVSTHKHGPRNAFEYVG